jgi:hypothetical protein
MTLAMWAGAVVLAIIVASPIDARAISIFSDAGATTAAIQDTVDAYRAALGDPNNGSTASPQPSGRREINWDGGGALDGTAPVTPFVVFRNIRGATFTTPGVGLTQAPATGGLLSLDLINPTYDDLFAPFSPVRLFTPVGSNVTDVTFSIPGSGGTVPAGVSGFGAVFSDVDLFGATTIEYFDTAQASLGVFDVPAFTGNQTFSFFGITTGANEPLIGSARIVTGSAALGPNETPSLDMVVMDDVLYGEPKVVPEPSFAHLLGLGLVALTVFQRRRRP